mmetsp:Transcript_32035/g.32670  ORF Transcript_32035/g.32670 Transcript_32035/m.32670 type:complete len:335 (+) Transcript_32035:54-1058(+)
MNQGKNLLDNVESLPLMGYQTVDVDDNKNLTAEKNSPGDSFQRSSVLVGTMLFVIALTAAIYQSGFLTANSSATNVYFTASAPLSSTNPIQTNLLRTPTFSVKTASNDMDVSAIQSAPANVDLGAVESFAIVSKAGITDVPTSSVTGDVGTSPITGAAIGLLCSEITGIVYSVDAAGPSCRITNPSFLTTVIGDMGIAYTDAAARLNANTTELGAGNIGGMTLPPGVHKWSSALLIPATIYLSGPANATWIFQIAQTLTVASNVQVILSGGAKASHIFWQAAGSVILGTGSHFEGNILGKTSITLNTGASINGRLLAQTEVVLQMATVVKPPAN